MDQKRLTEILDKIVLFNDERGWNPQPQDIAKSVVLEAAELLEHFQWDGGKSTGIQGKDLKEIKYEVADVFWYLTIFCHKTGIDIVDALELKYLHNTEKYPKEKFVDGHNEEFYRSQKIKYRQNKK